MLLQGPGDVLFPSQVVANPIISESRRLGKIETDLIKVSAEMKNYMKILCSPPETVDNLKEEILNSFQYIANLQAKSLELLSGLDKSPSQSSSDLGVPAEASAPPPTPGNTGGLQGDLGLQGW